MVRFLSVTAFFLAVMTMPVRAEDGYELWLRYRPMEAEAQAQYRPLATVIVGVVAVGLAGVALGRRA